MCTDFRCIRISSSGGITVSAVLKLPIQWTPELNPVSCRRDLRCSEHYGPAFANWPDSLVTVMRWLWRQHTVQCTYKDWVQSWNRASTPWHQKLVHINKNFDRRLRKREPFGRPRTRSGYEGSIKTCKPEVRPCTLDSPYSDSCEHSRWNSFSVTTKSHWSNGRMLIATEQWHSPRGQRDKADSVSGVIII